MRPTYESGADLAAEQAAIGVAAQTWGASYAKLPNQYRVDFAVLRNKSIVAWAEVKCRKHPHGQYPTLILSLAKHIAGVEMERQTDKPFLVLARWQDRLGYIRPSQGSYEVCIGGRTDRNDWQDIEPVVHYPIADFKFMKGGE